MSETLEDFKLLKKECEDVKVENVQIRKELQEGNELKKENAMLKQQLKDQEIETLKAMKAIELGIEEETNKVMKTIERQIDSETEKKLAEMKEEKKKILEDL